MEDVRPCQDKEEAKKVLAELSRPDTAFLFKASRGMALEELCAFVREFDAG
jgi:UDP-N-acetylmuramyl pentapeptide synthase